MQEYDLIVIGSGAALIVLEAALARGLRCALIEKGKYGGTCLNRGCIPSKILVHPADLIRETERGHKIGLHIQPPAIDWPFIAQRMWQKIGENQEIAVAFRQMPNLTVYEGLGYFIAPKMLQVRYPDGTVSERLHGAKVCIGVGGRARVPDIEGLEAAGYLNFERFFGDQFPTQIFKRLLIVGGGAIGLEFAHIFSAYGTEVTILDHNPRLGKHEEPEVSELLTAEFTRLGIRVRTDCELIAVESQKVPAPAPDKTAAQASHVTPAQDSGKTPAQAPGKKVTILHRASGQLEELSCDEIFLATGIRSNADILQAEAGGIELNERGWIVTDEYLRTSQPDVYAVGDINGQFQFRHKANYEAYIVAHNLYSPELPPRVAHYDRVPWAIFTHPQIAHVGLTEREALEAGHKVLAGKNYYSAIAKGYAMGYCPNDQDDGFVKLVVNDKLKILGVHIIGPQAALLIQPFVYLMNSGLTCQSSEPGNPDQHQPEHDFAQTAIRPRLCIDPGTITAIDQAMVIHPALSEVAAWATGTLTPVDPL